MTEQVFRRTEILLPKRQTDMEKWSVVACDQFTSQRPYWDGLERLCAGVPSTLHLIFPEAYLNDRDQEETAERLRRTMEKYLRDGVFEAYPDSYVLTERTLPGGGARYGIVGALDLEAYDYRPEAQTPVRATEGTVESRLPPRVRIRRGAALECPHVMVFLDDPALSVVRPLSRRRESLPLLYDFDLNAGGGHVRGWLVSGPEADALDAALAAVAGEIPADGQKPLPFAVGDGNHSLATAKLCWEELKQSLSPEQRETHPARWSLVELVNIHDETIGFEPIHRGLLGTDPAAFLREARERFAERYRPGESVESGSAAGEKTFSLLAVTPAGEERIETGAPSIGALIGRAEAFVQAYRSAHGGEVDYIHNDETALALGRQTGCASLLLPAMEKGELFPSVRATGPFPRKSFSIGRAEDKRYYLECRRILPED